jgi:UDP-N-acetylmuramoylalanine-D-glutamate ligase
MTMELKGRSALVVGLARTGAAAARFLQQRGARVLVSSGRRAKSGPKPPLCKRWGFRCPTVAARVEEGAAEGR